MALEAHGEDEAGERLRGQRTRAARLSSIQTKQDVALICSYLKENGSEASDDGGMGLGARRSDGNGSRGLAALLVELSGGRTVSLGLRAHLVVPLEADEAEEWWQWSGSRQGLRPPLLDR